LTRHLGSFGTFESQGRKGMHDCRKMEEIGCVYDVYSQET
jgi:hypothetical protein